MRALAALALILLFAGRAAAEPVHLRYEAYWGGLHVADFTLTLDDRQDGYAHDFHLRSRGLADWFIRLEVKAESRGRRDAEGLPAPERYYVRYRNRYRERELEVRFHPDRPADATGRTLSGTRPDSADFGGSDQLAPEHRTGIIDPVGALAEALARTDRHVGRGGAGDFTLEVFDGRRRFDVGGAYGGRTRRDVRGQEYDLHRLRLDTRPIAGFRKVHKMLWDGSSFDLFLSADGRPIPRQIVAIGPGPVINLAEQCDTPCVLEE